MTEENWKEICSVSGMAEAKIIAGRLEAEGIPATLKYEAVGVIYNITIDGLGEVKILIPGDRLEEAKAALAQSFDEKDLDWDQ